MGSPSDAPNQIITMPQGGGALHGIGEKFSPDLFTGTGNFTIPIALPPGRTGFKPDLNLVYSSGNGNGPFGFGWSLSIPGVSRKTSKGIPRYNDQSDTFLLSGAEDLVPVAHPELGLTQYRPRTEGLFARITHHHLDPANNFWEVKSKDGLTSRYGTPGSAGNDPAVISDPTVPNQAKIFAWKLSSTTDPFGNLIQYSYSRDVHQEEGPHHWDQLYVSQIRYVDYGQDRQNPNFLVRVNLSYADRPDPFSEYRAGFEIRTIQRCTRVDVMTGSAGNTPVRTYHLNYADEDLLHADRVPANGASLLWQVRVEGRDGNTSEWLPPLEFAYAQFQPQTRKHVSVQGSLPANSLTDPNLELIDLFGNGLPDILEMNGSVRYWRNCGNGQFALPHSMSEAPPFELSDKGVQLLDANGDGTADLLVTTQVLSGYYPLRFDGLWDKHSFQRYRKPPSFSLKDPEVHFVDLDGDGVTDAIRSSTRFECYFNDPEQGWTNNITIQRESLDVFPNVDFSDPRVKWADMTGDGLQDIVFVRDGLIEYWPSLGRGNWGKRVAMPGPRFPWGYDPRRMLLGDVDGDGAADLVYVDDMRITLWINQSGNSWSPPISISGTPPVSDSDSVRLVDLLGNGTAGLLWSKNSNGVSRTNAFFLDFTGEIKPYLLDEMNNHLGAITHVGYKPSTWFYLQDQQRPQTRWTTPLPFPVQVVARVESRDMFSGGKLTREYSYHHGYWDGYEREFRGFGRVDQRDTEPFNNSTTVAPQYFCPPTEIRTWFHQGAIGDRFDGWTESDATPALPGQKRFTDEYCKEPWPGSQPTAQVLSRPSAMNAFIGSLPPSVRRDAFRSMRGKILRTELYALDGTTRQHRPYTVTEHVYGVQEQSPPARGDVERLHIFFPFLLSERKTQWERGGDPLSVFTFTDNCEISEGALETADYDRYGQPLTKISIAVPRGRAFQLPAVPGELYLATQSVSTYAQRDDNQLYIVDRTSSATTFELLNDGSTSIFELARQVQAGTVQTNVVSQSITFYDGDAFQGLPLGQLGTYGAVVRAETLVLTPAALAAVYGTNQPPYLTPTGQPNWTSDYPQEFRDKLPVRAGYVYRDWGTGTIYQSGYYQPTDQRQYDFQSVEGSLHGLVIAKRDPLGHETSIVYDNPYAFLAVSVTQAAGLQGQLPIVTQAQYDYRVLQPNLVTDPNGNQTAYSFTPLGLLQTILVTGKPGEGLGDTPAAPGAKFTYTFSQVDASGNAVPVADVGEPVSVQTTRREHHASETDVPLPERDEVIETLEFSDGFGRVLQRRTQAEDVLFDSASPSPTFGDAGLPASPQYPGRDAVGQLTETESPFVVVSGWQVYDNKGQVVEKYEPFFSSGWVYAAPLESQFGRKALLHYDPLGRVIRTVNPDRSEQRVIYGVPGTIGAPDLTSPDLFEPTPWEAYGYDANDNAGRTHASSSTAYEEHWNTPSSVVIDALGRTVTSVERNREKQAGLWSPIIEYATRSTYDIVGNLLTVTDPLVRQAFTYAYDLAKHSLLTLSIDAGTHTIVLDAAGSEVERRDSKGALVLRSYDVLNRPIRIWGRDVASDNITLREKAIYGDDSADSGYSAGQAAALNLIGKPYKQYDEAGLLTFTAYDFKGNLLDKMRNVISTSALLSVFGPPLPQNWIVQPFRVDWNSNAQLLLDTVDYQITTAYDALNRVKRMQYPRDVDGGRKLLVPLYNRAGALESVTLDGTTYVQRIAYNAKGQRILIAYGSGLMTRYAYGRDTFRLLRMRTEADTLAQVSPPIYHPSAPSSPLQDFAYEYDLVGNILAIHDRTPGSGIENTQLGVNALDRSFTYDPIYRLVSATGREHERPLGPPPLPWDDTIHPINLITARAYAETYQYDRVGNMALWGHTQFGAGGRTSTVNRSFNLVANDASNRLSTLKVGTNITYSYRYDPSGNLTSENTERHFEWDHSDRLRVFRNQTNRVEPTVYAQYAYDSSGTRVLKLVRKSGGQIELSIYIDGVFEYQKVVRLGEIWQNNTLHVMDNKSRVALVRLGAALPGDGADNVPVKYQLGDHLGSSNVVVDANGSVVNREEFLPYGETSFGSYARKRYRFTGKERDEENSLNYHGARYYAPWLARWSSHDPAMLTDGLNLYSYARNNPTGFVDSNGLASDSGDSAPANTDTGREPNIYKDASGRVHLVIRPTKADEDVSSSPSSNLDKAGKATEAVGVASSVAEGAIWNPVLGGVVNRQVMGSIWNRRGKVLEFLAGNNRLQGGLLGAKDADRITATSVIQMKSTMRATEVGQIARDATRAAARYITDHPLATTGRSPQAQIFLRTGATRAMVVEAENALSAATKSLPNGALPPKVTVGLPGAVGTVAKTANVLGGAYSAYSLYRDYQRGDVANGFADAAGVVSSGATIAAGVTGSTALATVGSLAGAFAVGYAIGTGLNYFLDPLVSKLAPGSGPLGEWYYRTFLK